MAEYTMGHNKETPQPQRLPAQYGIVTLNVSKCINSMIEEYRSESRTELLEGTFHHMTTEDN